MVYIRKKIIKEKEYYYIVKGEKSKKNTKQIHVAYIGDKTALQKFYDNIKKKLD